MKSLNAKSILSQIFIIKLKKEESQPEHILCQQHLCASQHADFLCSSLCGCQLDARAHQCLA